MRKTKKIMNPRAVKLERKENARRWAMLLWLAREHKRNRRLGLQG